MSEYTYEHKVQYYETDQMQVVHHSNYVRWFEEARTVCLEQIGLPYDEMERSGVMCPVLEINAKYLQTVRFGDTVSIRTRISSYNSVKLAMEYEIVNHRTGKVHCTGTSKHCFLNGEYKPVSLRREYPAYHEQLQRIYESTQK